MRRPLQLTFSALLVVMLAIGCFFGAIRGLRRESPRVGETASAVMERFGPPHFDSRIENGDTEQDYRLGYTLGIGTRHHLHVKGGRIIEIDYSSR